MTHPVDLAAVVARVDDYLAFGGLFNLEMFDHDAVRDLLIDCRAALAAARQDGRYQNLARKARAHRAQIRGMQAKIALLNKTCEHYAASNLNLRHRVGELTALRARTEAPDAE